MIKNSNYVLHSNCIPIFGVNRSIIYDLFYNKYYFVPNEICIILIKNPNGNLENILINKTDIEKNEIIEYFEYLKEEKIIFYFDYPDFFPEISLNYKTPNFITNAIIEINSNINIEKTLKIVSEIHIPAIVLIIENNKILDYKKLLDYFEGTNTQHIEIILRNYKEIDAEIFNHNTRLNKIKVYNSKFQKIRNLDNEITKYIEYKNDNINFKPKISFNINLELFSESKHNHTYFNKKIYIGKNGEIKNAPECEDIFGNIQNITDFNDIINITKTKNFRKYWGINKEKIDVCKECEFRHMCTDNRVPFKRKKNEWFHKTECFFNPYISKWKEEEGYKTLSECGVISNENGFSIDHDKIAEINKVLWGE
jgi:SPASM domain peptide maturase of grasp-with-spasm system